MPAANALLSFAAASFVLLIIPGPAVLYIVNRSMSDGRSVALASVAGLEIGNLTHGIAATAGLSAVIAASATAFGVIKWAGAIYLVGVGLGALLRRPAAVSLSSDHLSRHRAFRQGVIVNVLNPKTGLFFLSYLPHFIDPNRGPTWPQALTLGILFVLIACVTDSVWAIGTSGLRDVLLRGKSLAFMQRCVSGSVFVVLGVLAAQAHQAA